ncbi:MAG TPA: gfo/Idh/MocA family oxidoreductase, partial [Roseiflexaceae bacterium]|nr:gfo/Idh/MocA family oxidoreductase [Roseiflexaceae bacterium]
ADGGYGTIEVSKLVPGAGDDLRIEAYGANGTMIFDTRDPNGIEVVEGGASRRLATLSRSRPTAVLPSAETPSATVQWHLASIAGFLAGEPGWPDLVAGLTVDRVIDAARRSIQAHGAWMDVI